jgi:hypothetical protein
MRDLLTNSQRRQYPRLKLCHEKQFSSLAGWPSWCIHIHPRESPVDRCPSDRYNHLHYQLETKEIDATHSL